MGSSEQDREKISLPAEEKMNFKYNPVYEQTG
jgi:hypothetical protein